MSSSRFTVLALLASATVWAAPTEYRQGEVIVKYKDSAVRTRATMNALYDATGVKRVKRFSKNLSGMEHLILSENIKTEDAIATLLKNPSVDYAQPNYIIRLPRYAKAVSLEDPTIPCIPGFEIPGCTDMGGGGGGGGTPCLIPGIPFPPGCEDGGGGPGGPDARPEVKPAPADTVPPVADPNMAQSYGLAKIGATDAWNTFSGSKDFIVADIDTGVDYNHEDMSFNMWRNPNPGPKKDIVGYDYIHDDGLPFDDNEHGTHTSGTIGAVGGNGKGTSGVAQRVSIMALKFLSGQGEGDTAGAIKSIDYAVEHGAKVLSNSWGGPSDESNQALYDAIERAKAKDVLFIAASGNSSKNNDNPSEASYPAGFDNDNLISVAATDAKDGWAFFSNFGVKTTHLAAPGVNVYSTVPGNKYAQFSGTSMACPHVAGAAALVWAANPTWNYKQVKTALLNTVDPLPSLKGKVSTGGRLNVLKALRSKE